VCLCWFAADIELHIVAVLMSLTDADSPDDFRADAVSVRLRVKCCLALLFSLSVSLSLSLFVLLRLLCNVAITTSHVGAIRVEKVSLLVNVYDMTCCCQRFGN